MLLVMIERMRCSVMDGPPHTLTSSFLLQAEQANEKLQGKVEQLKAHEA